MKATATFGVATALIIGVGAGVLPDCSKAPLSSNKICDTKASPRERAAAFVAVMQTSEKLANLVR